MKQTVTIVLIAALFSMGLEGAVDAASLLDQHDAGGHEMHQPHPFDDHGSGDGEPDAGESAHFHVCHCGVHVPPMLSAFDAPLDGRRHVEPFFEPFAYFFLPAPPRLRPPIV